MKRIISVILITIILSLSAVCAAEIPENRLLPRVVDRADILDSYEEAELTALCDQISEEIQCDVAVVTVNSLGGESAQAYADDFYDYNGYGMGAGDDGILLLLAMNEREWAFTTYGLAIRAIPGYALDEIADDIIPSLSKGDYYGAFTEYAELARDYVSYYNASGSVLGFDKYSDFDDRFYTNDEFYYGEHSSLTTGEKLGVSAVISAIVALIIMLSMKSGMKTIRSNNYASPYVVRDSLNLRTSRDMYLYRNVTKTRRETESSSHSGSRGGRFGGGGGTHISSSGRSHGGRSGRF